MSSARALPRLHDRQDFCPCYALQTGSHYGEKSHGLLYSIGFVIATGCLHLIGVAIGLVHRWNRGRRAVQGAGARVAMGGLFFL